MHYGQVITGFETYVGNSPWLMPRFQSEVQCFRWESPLQQEGLVWSREKPREKLPH